MFQSVDEMSGIKRRIECLNVIDIVERKKKRTYGDISICITIMDNMIESLEMLQKQVCEVCTCRQLFLRIFHVHANWVIDQCYTSYFGDSRDELHEELLECFEHWHKSCCSILGDDAQLKIRDKMKPDHFPIPEKVEHLDGCLMGECDKHWSNDSSFLKKHVTVANRAAYVEETELSRYQVAFQYYVLFLASTRKFPSE